MNIFKGVIKRKLHKDPVCGMSATGSITSKHNSQTYYFCSAYCKQEFEAAPGKYILDENN